MIVKPSKIGLILSLMASLLAWSGIGTTVAANGSEGRTLVIGKVSSNPKKHYRYLKPMADYMVERMGDLGYTDSDVLMAKDFKQLARYMRQGKVDWVTESPFPSARLHRDAGAEYIARKWKKGVAEYHTVLFARKDSGISSIEDLKGKVIAFQDRDSSTACYLPAGMILDKGIEMVEMGSPRDQPGPDQVGYIFADEEINQSTWVQKGIVAAGAFSSTDWTEDDRNPPAFREELAVFDRSDSIPRAVELVRSDLPVEVKDRLTEILMVIHNDETAKGILHSYQKANKFDRMDDQIRAELEYIERLIDLVDDNLD